MDTSAPYGQSAPINDNSFGQEFSSISNNKPAFVDKPQPQKGMMLADKPPLANRTSTELIAN